MRRVTLATVLGTLAFATPAQAYYGNGGQIVSADYDRLEQGDDATVFAAISDDGRYVVIQTRARNFFADDDPDPPGFYRAGGIFRFNLETRDASRKLPTETCSDEADSELLAAAPRTRRSAPTAATSPSRRHSQSGPADTNDNVDVYVRDMDVPIGQPGAFDLVTARDGGDVPATYGPPAVPFPGSNPGSDVTRGVAISGDGQRVVFRHTSAPRTCRRAATADVPAGQILVRDRAANTTTLVTREMAGGASGRRRAGPRRSAPTARTVVWTGE